MNRRIQKTGFHFEALNPTTKQKERIAIDHMVLARKPVIPGAKLAVDLIVDKLGQG